MLEMMVALAVAAMLLGASAPVANKLYKSMQYRSSLTEIRHLIDTGKYLAQSRGHSVDLVFNVELRQVQLDDMTYVLPDHLSLNVVAARELQRGKDSAVIRFYPDGGASGGDIIISRPSGGTKISVGWLLGDVQQQRLD
ncbi:hypothetical protein R50076_26590 [Gilvimarinus japonicus]